MSIITVQENPVYFVSSEKVESSRPTLLFVHGAGQRIATWRFQEDLFRNHPDFNYIALDLPGRGGSGGKGLKSVEDYTNFLLYFIDALKLESIIFIGHSMGGAIGMLIGIEHPEILKALVLVATSPKLSVPQQTLENTRDHYADFCDVSPNRAFAEESAQELRDQYKLGLIDTGSEVCHGDLVACNKFDVKDEVDKIRLPTLIVSADKDLMTPAKNGEYLHQKIYGSEFHVLRNSGHFLMQEKIQEFNTILNDFVNNFVE